MFKRHFFHLLLFVLSFLPATAFAQTTHKTREEAEKATGQGITFKVPDKFMRAPLSGFKGLLMLNADAPAAIVISYPNDSEPLDALTKRLLAAVPGFFGGSGSEVPEWIAKPIPINLGDKAGSGVLYTGKRSDMQLQLALFHREWKGLTVAYGYFAMRNDKAKEKDVKKYWLDDNGLGVKPFEAFWKSFPEHAGATGIQ